jgi:hypothetical protein
LTKILVRPSTLEPEEPHPGEVAPELVLLALKVADLLAELADLQCLKWSNLGKKLENSYKMG